MLEFFFGGAVKRIQEASNSEGLHPSSDGLQPNSDGLHPTLTFLCVVEPT